MRNQPALFPTIPINKLVTRSFQPPELSIMDSPLTPQPDLQKIFTAPGTSHIPSGLVVKKKHDKAYQDTAHTFTPIPGVVQTQVIPVFSQSNHATQYTSRMALLEQQQNGPRKNVHVSDPFLKSGKTKGELSRFAQPNFTPCVLFAWRR